MYIVIVYFINSVYVCLKYGSNQSLSIYLRVFVWKIYFSYFLLLQNGRRRIGFALCLPSALALTEIEVTF